MKRLSVCVLERSRRASPSERSITLDLHNVHFTQSAPRPENNNNNMTKTMRKTKNFFLPGVVVCLYCVREERCWIGPVNLVTLFILSRQRRKWEIIFLTFFHQHIIKGLFALWFTLSTFSDVVNVLTCSSHIICYTSLTVPFVSVQQNNAVWELHLKLKWFIILPDAKHWNYQYFFIFFLHYLSSNCLISLWKKQKLTLIGGPVSKFGAYSLPVRKTWWQQVTSLGAPSSTKDWEGTI